MRVSLWQSNVRLEILSRRCVLLTIATNTDYPLHFFTGLYSKFSKTVNCKQQYNEQNCYGNTTTPAAVVVAVEATATKLTTNYRTHPSKRASHNFSTRHLTASFCCCCWVYLKFCYARRSNGFRSQRQKN